MKVAGLELGDAAPVAGGDICQAFRAILNLGDVVFAKTHHAAPPGMFLAEARGLDRLRVEGGPRVPRVVAVADDGLVLEWVAGRAPSHQAAVRFGRELATLHRSAGENFGADEPGYLATIPLDNTLEPTWSAFHANRRLLPVLDAAQRRGAVDDDQAAIMTSLVERLEDLAGPPEPPALIHGDLWSGNLLWASELVWLVDAASAHWGHRETDLAMLALFGAPYLQEIVAAYDATYPLAAGWRARVPLHQVFPLLVHAALFGGGYGARAAQAAAAALAVDG